MSTHPGVETDPGRGSITAVVLCWVTLIVGLAGLVIDGGRVVSTHVRVSDQAAAAARAGAQQLTDIRAGSPRIDCVRAEAVTRAGLARTPHQSIRITCDTGAISVTLVATVRTTGLRFFGVGDRRVSVTREVRILQG